MHEGNLYSLLHGVSRATLVLEVLRAGLGGIGLFIATVLLAMTVDAVLSLQPWGLIAIDLLLVSLLGLLGAFATLQAYRNLFFPRRAARLVEEHLGLTDNCLINAVEFSLQPTGSVSPDLLRKSVDDGEALAAELDVLKCIKYSRLLRPAGVACGMMLFLVVSYCLVPQAFGMVLPRLLDPTGDHPPFTLLHFQVTVTPEKIYHGRGANIAVELSGPQVPNRADVVFLRHESKQRSPMFRTDDTHFVLPLEKAESTCEFYIDTPSGRSRRFLLPVLEVPLFEKIELNYEFPQYTQWPSARHGLDARGIQALLGTHVTVHVKSNIPLSSGTLTLTPSENLVAAGDQSPAAATKPPAVTQQIRLVPSAADVTTVTATFPIEFSGTFQLDLTAANGAQSLEEIQGPLTAVADRAPRVAIIEPAPHLIVVENWKVPVTIQASDDVAVSRLRLYRSINGWGPTAVEIPLESKLPTLVTGHYEFDLQALGARAGDVIQYFASAADNCPPSGQFTDTEGCVIQVISEADYKEMARRDYQLADMEQEFDRFLEQLTALQQEREELLKSLEALREKLESGQALTAAEQEQLTQQEQQVKDYQQQAEKLAQALHDRAAQPQIYDLEQPYQEMLKQLGQQVAEQGTQAAAAAEQLKKLRDQPASDSARKSAEEALEKLARTDQPFDKDSQQQLEQSADELRKIRKADELLAQGEQLRAITLKQRDIADRLDQFRDRNQLTGDDQQRAARLAKEQEVLQQELEEVAEALKQSALAARDEIPQMAEDAVKLMDELQGLKIPDDQRQAARAARQGAGERARAASDTAATKLESILSKLCNCKGAGQSLAKDLDGPFKLPGAGLENALQQFAQGRRMPGLPRNGSSPGQAQGMAGEGLAGSRSRAVIAGPHIQSQGETASAQARLMKAGGRGMGIGPATNSAEEPGPESLAPAAGSKRSVSGQYLRGVPVGYRDQAEAYFKRLAEEK